MKILKELRILIVEDDALISEVIQNQLEKIGHIVAGRVSDGKQAVEMVLSLKPDVVLMDIVMPELDGLEAARLIHEKCPTPVVLLSAHDNIELVYQASEAGAGAYLVKPTTSNEMERTIAIAVARFHDWMELQRLNGELQKSLEEIKTLQGLLPICASCKKIRDNQGYWHQVEAYLQKYTTVTFTHGICEECSNKLYPQYMTKNINTQLSPE